MTIPVEMKVQLFRKLRDEYDKLEGALRKLGVDSEIGNSNNLEDFEDEGNIFDEGEFSDFEEEPREVSSKSQVVDTRVF